MAKIQIGYKYDYELRVVYELMSRVVFFYSEVSSTKFVNMFMLFDICCFIGTGSRCNLAF